MPTVNANDLDIGYEVLGMGPPLVLLHAASSSSRLDFEAQFPQLAERFRVYLPDARGHGATRWDTALGFQTDWLVDDLEAFADALGLETMHLVGFSMGAMTGLGFAVRHPGRVRSLVLAGISPEREPRASIVRRLLDPDRIERDDPAWAAQLARRHDPVQGPDAWRRLARSVAEDVATQPLLSPRDLHAIEAPVLVMCGDRDPFVPVDQAWRLSRQVAHGRLLVAPDCGHQVLSERSDLANVALSSFYGSIESVARGRAERQPEVSR
jgi:pimeloyl-ACP methyl ester carboxylesterase